MKKSEALSWISRTVLAIFAIYTLGLTITGAYQGAWYGGFGLVLFMTALLCNIALYIPAYAWGSVSTRKFQGAQRTPESSGTPQFKQAG